MICQHCWLPIVWYHFGWKHHPGPGGRVPQPGHLIEPIPARSLDRIGDGINLSERVADDQEQEPP
jgi:hypothetical protein